MKIVAISDVHGETGYVDAAAELMCAADVVVICGDLSGRRDGKSAMDILAQVERHAPRIIAVHGNWDRDDVRVVLEDRGYSVHGRGILVGGTGFFGVGGARRSFFHMPSEYSEDEMGSLLEKGYRDIDGAERRVLVSHMPPYRVLDRSFLGLRGGSRAVSQFLERRRVDICIAGHIHEAHGVEDFFSCVVVNSGPFSRGRYSIVELGDGVRAELGVMRWRA